MSASECPELGLRQIIETALAIADHEGLHAVSMRRLGAEFRCSGTHLYKFVATKEALLDLMADHAVDSLPYPKPDGDWRAEISTFYTAFHELYLNHPSVAMIMTQRPLVGPNTVERGDRVLEALLAGGLDDSAALEAAIALASYTLGASLYELARRDTQKTTKRERFPNVSPERHPTIHRLNTRFVSLDGDRQFKRGLQRLIDTYATSIKPGPRTPLHQRPPRTPTT
jgi:AcrR family transcriptional regulator